MRRRGPASILEQIGVLGLGARLGADVLVAEVMSLHSENHQVESRRILEPHVLLVTNFRVDHLEAHGSRREDVARIMTLDVRAGARVLVHREALEAAFPTLVRRAGGRLMVVEPEADPGVQDLPGSRTNRALVRAAARVLGAEADAVERGIRGARQDVGGLRCWRMPGAGGAGSWTVVNAFAANDPESTLLVLEGLLGRLERGQGAESLKPVGLLLLRKDRGDRSTLWAQALAAGALSRFSRLYVHGFHARALQRILRGPADVPVTIPQGSRPEEILAQVTREGRPEGDESDPPRILFGFGNIGGMGERMVRHWEAVGTPLPLGRMAELGGGGLHGI
jgi:hypothetical protein